MSLDILNSLIEDAIELQSVDLTETGTGGGGIMPEGYAMARLVTYVELGQQPQEFNGKPKNPADEFFVGFKLFGGDGDCYDGRFIKTFDLALSNNAKAGAKVLFDKLNWKGDMKHIAQALGRAFLVPIIIKKGADGKERNRINLAGILPPIDVVSKSAYPIPEVDMGDLKYFFFNKPTKGTWEALFVEGQWDDGGSKNKVQEKIMSALNFPGSELEQLVSGVVLPDLQDEAPADEPVAEPATPAPKAKAVPKMPSMPAMPSLPTPSE
jgi:hypothetical protein